MRLTMGWERRLPDSSEKPVVFISRTLSDSEKNALIEKEALACVVGETRFCSFLYGHRFIMQTDHKAKAIPQWAANQIQRWALTLSSYEYVIEWWNTTSHANADTLSRLPLPDLPTTSTTPPETVLLIESLAAEIANWTQQTPLFS